MTPRTTVEPDDVAEDDVPVEQPIEQDEAENLPPESHLRRRSEPAGGLPGEDDDNPYQDSDEALPDDQEEEVISRSPGKEGTRFDEV